jgi:regulatory protein
VFRNKTPHPKKHHMNEKAFNRAYGKIINFISYQTRTEKEITDRLNRVFLKSRLDEKEISEVKDKVWESIRELNLVNDEEYAKTYVSGLLYSGKAKSIRSARNFLMKKGISRDIMDDVLQELGGDFEKEAAQKDAQKKLRTLRKYLKTDKRIAKQKLIEYLLRKGYSMDSVRAAVDTMPDLK